MEKYICLTLSVTSPQQAEELIAFLADSGFEGFEERADRLLAYRPEGEWNRQEVLNHLSARAEILSEEGIEKTNWNQVWESHFEPVRVGDFVGLRAAFHPPITDVEYDLIVTPKMSFGTGHHATTQLMVQAMRALIRPGDRVLDFGTGTGVLAILAKKMGADEVVGIDIEDWSIENAIDNARVNGVLDISFLCADQIEVSGPFDRILANINRNILLEHLPRMRELLSPEGDLLMSGILEEDLPDMDRALSILGMNRLNQSAERGWICIQATHGQ